MDTPTLYLILAHILILSLQQEFREYPALLRQAVSLARRLQDPLIEFSQLCNPDEDILALKYHPLQVLRLLNNTVGQIALDISFLQVECVDVNSSACTQP